MGRTGAVEADVSLAAVGVPDGRLVGVELALLVATLLAGKGASVGLTGGLSVAFQQHCREERRHFRQAPGFEPSPCPVPCRHFCLVAKRNMRVCIKTSIIKLAWIGPGERAVQGGVGNTYMSPRNALRVRLMHFPPSIYSWSSQERPPQFAMSPLCTHL